MANIALYLPGVPDVIVVKAEHIALGKQKSIAVRDKHLEKLFGANNINNKEVYRFNDGRILVVDNILKNGFLYSNEKVFYDKVIL